jgi:hypothetical protein
MTKVVYSACHGGFGLSAAGMSRYTELKGEKPARDRDIPRSEPALVQVVEELGEAASGRYANLQIRDVPSGTKYRIDEYDGFEAVVTIDEHDWEMA